MSKLEKYIDVPIEQIKPEISPQFPIYIYLSLNQRYLKIRLSGHSLDFEYYERYKLKGVKRLFIHESDQHQLVDYIKKVGPVDDPSVSGLLNNTPEENNDPSSDNKAKPEFKAQPREELPDSPQKRKVMEVQAALQANIIPELLNDKDISEDERKEVLKGVSQTLIESLIQIESSNPEDIAKGLESCKKIAQDVLMAVTKGDDIYEEAAELIKLSSEIKDHSVATSSLAATFAMLLGFSMSQDLADVSVAGLFHDYGLITLDPKLIQKPANQRTQAESKTYQEHWAKGPIKLKEIRDDFPHNNALRFIQEVHESYDGSGYPKGLQGEQIHELSQVLAVVNVMDNIVKGRFDGTSKSPNDAFKMIVDLTNPYPLQKFNPQITSMLASLVPL